MIDVESSSIPKNVTRWVGETTLRQLTLNPREWSKRIRVMSSTWHFAWVLLMMRKSSRITAWKPRRAIMRTIASSKNGSEKKTTPRCQSSSCKTKPSRLMWSFNDEPYGGTAISYRARFTRIRFRYRANRVNTTGFRVNLGNTARVLLRINDPCPVWSRDL